MQVAELHHMERIFRTLTSGIARTVQVLCVCVCTQVQIRGGMGRKAQGLCSGSALLILDPSPRLPVPVGTGLLRCNATGAQETRLSIQGFH